MIAASGEASTLVIGEQAEVNGEIRVSHVVVNGKVVGPVIADGYVELQPKATGDRRCELQDTRNARRRRAARAFESRLNQAPRRWSN